MPLSFQHTALAAALSFVALSVYAKTASEVYEQAARSTVVVESLDAKGKMKGMGSGVVLGNGHVVTNCHVVKDASRLRVRSGDKEHAATLRYSDWERDVCSLSSVGLSAPAAVLGSTKKLKVGATVYAIGAPKGLNLTLSDGIVSSLREVEGGRYIQTTAAISPGSSGGGLFDENGALVGLTSFYLAEGQNLNFAVPIEWVNELAQRSTRVASVAEPVTQWMNKAIELESREDWPAFIEHCRRWTKAQPSSDWAWISLGNAYGNAGQPAKAIEAYQQALRINPEQAPAWSNLGVIYRQTGQFAKAIEAYQQALRIYPEYADAWNGLGVTYATDGQSDKAIEAYQQALSTEPELFNAWINMGNAYGKAGQSSKAIDAYQQALRINPEYVNAWNGLGFAYGNTGQPTKAIDAYQQALRINPDGAYAWNGLGFAYGKTGQPSKAIEAYKQALRINPDDVFAWNGLGFAYAQSGQRANVLVVYKRLKTLDLALAERFFNKVVVP
jgi:tetratricopeptide (TPR) repeat protein